MANAKTKLLNMKKIISSTGIVLAILSLPNIVQAQSYQPWTGKVVGATVDFGNNDELSNIRTLLNEGKIDDAVRASKKAVERFEENRSGEISRMKYNAYNALCISLTASGDFDGALKACNEAIRQYPESWQAINSRGSLNYKAGKYSDALKDYQTALNKAPDTVYIKQVIEHNVKLSQGMLASN